MRIAVLSDIHGNGTAFEAVLTDLKRTAPDRVYHGGDLTDSGSSPVQICDAVCDFGWRGVLGNTDEMLFRPEALEEFASRLPALKTMFDAIREMAAFTRSALGEKRLAWLGALRLVEKSGDLGLVHATPETCWRAPSRDASDEELLAAYETVGASIIVHGHTHVGFIRKLGRLVIANAGSVGMPYDGDSRASYLLITDGQPELQRVQYDQERELQRLKDSGMPHAEWVAKTLLAATPVPL